MNHLSPNRLSILMQEYLDGVLNDADRKAIEDLVATDASAKQEFERLRKMRTLLSGQRKIEPNPSFWTRLSASLPQELEEDNLLPFPRRHFPAAALASIAGIVLIGTVIFQNRMSLFHFMSQKSQLVQSAYEEGIMKGSILPLLSHIDNNQVLQFSLLGVLPLDAKSQTALKVDQNSSNGYQIKLGKSTPSKSSSITVKDFYAEIQATNEQKDVIDSLFGLARRKIENSVLVSENHAVAIDPALAQLNRVMVSNIASCLEPFQRVRFGRFLERKDAPYTFVSKKFVPANPESIYVEMSRVPATRRFVVVTADTLTYANLDADVLRQIQHNVEIPVEREGIARRNLEMTERLLRHFAEREPRPVMPRMVNPQFEIWKDANTVSIQFQRDADEPRWEIRQPVVVPMPRRMGTYSLTSPAGRFEFGFYGDSVTAGEVMIDSAMVRFFNSDNAAAYNLRMMDSIFTTLNARFQMHPGAFPLDSVLRTVEEARRRTFEEGKHRQQTMQQEVRLKKKDSSSNER